MTVGDGTTIDAPLRTSSAGTSRQHARPTRSALPPRPPSDTETEQSLYAKREKIYPREVHGLYARLRVAGALLLLGIYYGLPWLRWDGRQAVLFDLPERKFYIFGLTFWPQDFIYLALLLVVAGLSLFFFTAIAGRLWCGYACPQTVWTEAFLWIERLVEGDRLQQIKRDKGPMGAAKLRTKATKHTTWVLFSLFTGVTFVGYFTPIDELTAGAATVNLSGWEWFWILFYAFATYGNAGWMREQVCIYMCPYARFQSAMFDADTLVIAYDRERGEPRGRRKRSVDHRKRGLGDCIDCTLCVQACPTGIDIRDGLQYECIGCAACIDACNDVMDKMGYPTGLVRYTSENAVRGRPRRILRARIIVYAAVLLSILTGVVYAVSQRNPLEIDILRDRNRLYQEASAGNIENVYTLKILNKDNQDHRLQLTASGIEGLDLATDRPVVDIAAGEVLAVAVRLRADRANLEKRSEEVVFEAVSLSDPHLSARRSTRFLGPLQP